MNIWTESADIDAMTSGEWLNYRDDLLDEFYKRGNVLKPTINCGSCDLDNDYTCFECEFFQIEGARAKK